LGINFGWKKSSSVFDNVYAPIVIVELQNSDGDWQGFELKVDSGAVITLMNPDDCIALGYKLDDGENKTLNVADNSELKVRVFRINVKIGDSKIPQEVRVAFAEKPIRELLLGRLDIFNHFNILLEGKILRTSFFI
jgi:hypothetical protein